MRQFNPPFGRRKPDFGNLIPVKGFKHGILKTLRKFEMLEPGEELWVALSGGPDSVALLHVLLDLQQLLRSSICAIHFNHGIRGEESEGDEQFVRELCAKLGVRLKVGRLSQKLAAGNLEGQLRQHRYDYFATQCPSGSVLATGHTLDDQAETVLMKFLRGAGSQGLAGIFPVRRDYPRAGLKLVRPLLQITRKQIVEYLSQQDARYRSDSTNQDLDLDRNWIRHKLLPQLEQRLNPSLKAILGRSAEMNRRLESWIEEESDRFILEFGEREETTLSLEVDALRAAPAFLRTAYLREAARMITEESLESDHLAQIERLLDLQAGRRFEGPGPLQVWRERDSLVFTRRNPQVCRSVEEFPFSLKVGKKQVTIDQEQTPPKSGQTEYCPLPNLQNELRIRNIHPEDRVRISTGKRTRRAKLSLLLSERGYSSRQRQELLALESGDEILWVEGLGAAEMKSPDKSEEHWLRVCVKGSD